MKQKQTSKPIAIAADHRGVALKARLKTWLAANGYTVKDCGTDSAAERVDAMDYALRVVTEIKQNRSDFAIAICGSGQMMAMTANRFPFIRATLLHTAAESAPARLHSDANVLVLGADIIDAATAEQILQIFLNTAALGDRYAERRERLAKLDISSMAAPVGQRIGVAKGAFKAPEPDKALDAAIAETFLKPKK
jgi:ribose 5-phosphate isomerase B